MRGLTDGKLVRYLRNLCALPSARVVCSRSRFCVFCASRVVASIRSFSPRLGRCLVATGSGPTAPSPRSPSAPGHSLLALARLQAWPQRAVSLGCPAHVVAPLPTLLHHSPASACRHRRAGTFAATVARRRGPPPTRASLRQCRASAPSAPHLHHAGPSLAAPQSTRCLPRHCRLRPSRSTPRRRCAPCRSSSTSSSTPSPPCRRKTRSSDRRDAPQHASITRDPFQLHHLAGASHPLERYQYTQS
jgi:hypothetical protein